MSSRSPPERTAFSSLSRPRRRGQHEGRTGHDRRGRIAGRPGGGNPLDERLTRSDFIEGSREVRQTTNTGAEIVDRQRTPVRAAAAGWASAVRPGRSRGHPASLISAELRRDTRTRPSRSAGPRRGTPDRPALTGGQVDRGRERVRLASAQCRQSRNPSLRTVSVNRSSCPV